MNTTHEEYLNIRENHRLFLEEANKNNDKIFYYKSRISFGIKMPELGVNIKLMQKRLLKAEKDKEWLKSKLEECEKLLY